MFSSPSPAGWLWPTVAQELQMWGDDDDCLTDDDLDAWYQDTHTTDED